MDEAERLCDRLAIVDKGQIIAEGTPAELIERLGGHHVVEFSLSGNGSGHATADWRALPGVEAVREAEGMVALNVREPHRTIPALLEAGITAAPSYCTSARGKPASRCFCNLTGRHLREE
jgi:ABC-2 type transport system ATP-binding protein